MLCHVLIRTKFVFNLDDSYYLIQNGFVFINGIVCLNKNFIIKKNDRVQLINYSYEYIYQRFVISNNITRYCRMWSTIYRYYNVKSQPYKTQQSSKRKWLIKSLWNSTDAPRFYEIDFTINTCFVLYNPISDIDIFPFFFSHFRFSIIKFYNWKYYY
jgi:hypothetical protein